MESHCQSNARQTYPQSEKANGCPSASFVIRKSEFEIDTDSVPAYGCLRLARRGSRPALPTPYARKSTVTAFLIQDGIGALESVGRAGLLARRRCVRGASRSLFQVSTVKPRSKMRYQQVGVGQRSADQHIGHVRQPRYGVTADGNDHFRTYRAQHEQAKLPVG